jgi:anti-anti-sigma factor
VTELMSRRHEPVCVDGEHPSSVRACADEPVHIVELWGELDLVSREAAITACSSAEHVDVLVDLSGLVFLDCAGYGALVAAADELKLRGGSLALTNAVGEPRRLLALIDDLEHGLCAPLGDIPVASPVRTG